MYLARVGSFFISLSALSSSSGVSTPIVVNSVKTMRIRPPFSVSLQALLAEDVHVVVEVVSDIAT